MNTYIAILRGINVSGKRLIKMEDLRNHLQCLPLTDIKTYIQSGNIVFKTADTNVEKIADNITAKIMEVYAFEVPVIVLSLDDLVFISKNNPFINKRNLETSKLHVTFLKVEADAEKLKLLASVSDSPNIYIATSKAIYFYCPEGYGNIKLNNNFIEAKLKVTATTRNWNTITHLIAMGM